MQKLGPGSTTLRYEIVAYTPGQRVELRRAMERIADEAAASMRDRLARLDSAA